MGTSFHLSYFDEYDLIVAMNEDIRSAIFRSMTLEHQEHYGPKCRLLSEFLSPTFCGINSKTKKDTEENPYDVMLHTLDYELREKVAPLADYLTDRSSNVFTTNEVEAALILASAGLTRFCLDTIDAQFDAAFQVLLENNFKKKDVEISWEKAEEQLVRCNASVMGYFSPAQRKRRFDCYMEEMRGLLQGGEEG